jgi:hypothetical protein
MEEKLDVSDEALVDLLLDPLVSAELRLDQLIYEDTGVHFPRYVLPPPACNSVAKPLLTG